MGEIERVRERGRKCVRKIERGNRERGRNNERTRGNVREREIYSEKYRKEK